MLQLAHTGSIQLLTSATPGGLPSSDLECDLYTLYTSGYILWVTYIIQGQGLHMIILLSCYEDFWFPTSPYCYGYCIVYGMVIGLSVLHTTSGMHDIVLWFLNMVGERSKSTYM